MKNFFIIAIGFVLLSFYSKGQDISLTIDTITNKNKVSINGVELKRHFSKGKIQKLLGNDYEIIKEPVIYGGHHRRYEPGSFDLIYNTNGLSFSGNNRYRLYILCITYDSVRNIRRSGEVIKTGPFSGRLRINGISTDSGMYSIDVKGLEKKLNANDRVSIYDSIIHLPFNCYFFYYNRSIDCDCLKTYFGIQFFISTGTIMHISFNTDDRMWRK